MGCCASRLRDNDPPALVVPPTPSSRNITAPSTRPGSSPSSLGSNAPATTNGRPNSALRPIFPTQRSKLPNTLASPTANSSHRVKPLTDSTNLRWTRARLEQERTDWWDTQVTGSPEVWGAIRIAAQHLQAGEVQEAQTMLDATGCTCPAGVLWKGVYDPTGVLYRVPEWLVVEPEGLMREGNENAESSAVGTGEVAGEDAGKEIMVEKDEMASVRIRTSHNQKDVVVSIQQRDMVASILEKLRTQTELPASSRIKLVYGGRPYHENDTLSANPFWAFANAHTLVALVLDDGRS